MIFLCFGPTSREEFAAGAGKGCRMLLVRAWAGPGASTTFAMRSRSCSRGVHDCRLMSKANSHTY